TRKLLVPLPQPGREEMTPVGREARVTVPSERWASVCTHPSPLVPTHDNPDCCASRLVNTLLADGAAVIVASDDVPSDTPASAIVSAADCVVPPSWILPLPQGRPVVTALPSVSLHSGDDDDDAFVVLTVQPESVELAFRVMPFPLPPGSKSASGVVEPCEVGQLGWLVVWVAGSLSTCDDDDCAPTGCWATPPALRFAPPVVTPPSTR